MCMTTTDAAAVCSLSYYLYFTYAERVYKVVETLEFYIFFRLPFKVHLAL